MSLKERLSQIFDVFSRRDARSRAGYPPDELSEALRNRLLLLYRDIVSGRWRADAWSQPQDHANEFWDQMHNALQHLHGRESLSGVHVRSQADDVSKFLARCTATEFFDFVELSFKLDVSWRVLSDENAVVDAINHLLQIEAAPFQLTQIVKVEEHGVRQGPHGYPRVGTAIRTVAYPKIIRAEDQTIHAESIQPALLALAAPHFEAANLEFRGALDEYRQGNYGDCLTKCGSAFESVMKSLCKRKNWPVDDKRATAQPLLKIVLSNSTLDAYFEQPLLLIATIRNRLSTSHGGGHAVRIAKRHVAQYTVTSTAAAILLLVHEVDG